MHNDLSRLRLYLPLFTLLLLRTTLSKNALGHAARAAET